MTVRLWNFFVAILLHKNREAQFIEQGGRIYAFCKKVSLLFAGLSTAYVLVRISLWNATSSNWGDNTDERERCHKTLRTAIPPADDVKVHGDPGNGTASLFFEWSSSLCSECGKWRTRLVFAY